MVTTTMVMMAISVGVVVIEITTARPLSTPCIPILNNAIGGLPPLPVPIDGDLPHFAMDLGDSNEGPNLSLKPCRDTGAAANIGYLGWRSLLSP